MTVAAHLPCQSLSHRRCPWSAHGLIVRRMKGEGIAQSFGSGRLPLQEFTCIHRGEHDNLRPNMRRPRRGSRPKPRAIQPDYLGSFTLFGGT